MFAKGSRYEKVPAFLPEQEGREPPFRGVRPRPVPTPVGVLEHVVASGERLDLLALKYYNNDRLWWRILDANPDILYGGDISLESMVGEVIVIPKAPGGR